MLFLQFQAKVTHAAREGDDGDRGCSRRPGNPRGGTNPRREADTGGGGGGGELLELLPHAAHGLANGAEAGDDLPERAGEASEVLLEALGGLLLLGGEVLVLLAGLGERGLPRL